MNEKPWWYPKIVNADYCKRLREDYPESAHMSDDELRTEYDCEEKYQHCWDHVGEAYKAFEKVADRMIELEAIIAKLPVTKDGVSVVPGMTVYWMYPTERSGGAKYCSTSGRVRYVKTMAPDDCRNMFIYPIEVETDNGTPYLRDCYSTRQAAQKASE